MSASSLGAISTLDAHPPVSILQANLKLVDANAVLQKVVKRFSLELRNRVILRCDELPNVQGTTESIERIFGDVLELIMEKKQAVDQLYLHINSGTAFSNAQDISLPKGLKRFLIQFHTNITPGKDWLQVSEQKINAIAAMLSPFGGSLSVNQFKNSGSLFCITLPGKQ